MRQFYVEYSDIQILEQLVPELMQLLKKEGKTTKNKFSFLEQPVPEIRNAKKGTRPNRYQYLSIITIFFAKFL